MGSPSVVKLQDENGIDWMALYSLEKQSDGDLRDQRMPPRQGAGQRRVRG